MHSLFNILYTLCLHEWSCRDHKTWKLIISYSKLFKSFSHCWKFASDATSGSFEPKCDKHNLNKTESLLSKKQKQNQKQTRRRLGKDLLNGDVHVSSDLLELSNAETKKRNQEHLQLGKEDEHRTGNSSRRCCPGSDNKSSADVSGVFFGVTATVRLHYLFSPLLFLISSSPQEQQWKSILLSCFSRSYLTSLHP